MKTDAYKKIKLASSFLVIITIFSNIFLFLSTIFYYNTLSIESYIMKNLYFTVKFTSKLLVYLNLILCFLCSYSFNIAYKFIMTISMWFIIITNFIGLISILKLNSESLDFIKIYLDTTNKNNEVDFLRKLLLYTKTKTFDEASKIYLKNYDQILNILLIVEIISLISLTVIFIEILIVRRIKIEEGIRAPPVIRENVSVGFNANSLRNKVLVPV